VAHYHGEHIVIGVRAEALTPVPADAPGDVLRGRIRHLEHHGHESLAFLDVGATAFVVDEIGAPVQSSSVATSGLRKFMNKLSGTNGSHPVDPLDTHANGAAGRHHRRPAELSVRLAPYPAVGPGHPLAVSVRVDALHFFEVQGKRIDVGWR
jgi:multiple sugar transport system ATP-binding protein